MDNDKRKSFYITGSRSTGFCARLKILDAGGKYVFDIDRDRDFVK